MALQRVYSTNAERQKAYRARLKGSPVASPAKKSRSSRPLSRPRRLAALLSEAEALLESYQGWQENLPEALQDSEQGQKLQDTITALEDVVTALENIEAPKGFGRD